MFQITSIYAWENKNGKWIMFEQQYCIHLVTLNMVWENTHAEKKCIYKLACNLFALGINMHHIIAWSFVALNHLFKFINSNNSSNNQKKNEAYKLGCLCVLVWSAFQIQLDLYPDTQAEHTTAEGLSTPTLSAGKYIFSPDSNASFESWNRMKYIIQYPIKMGDWENPSVI